MGNGQQPRGYTMPYFSPGAMTKQRQVIRSLIPPDNSAMFNKFKDRGRQFDVKHKGAKKRRQSTGSIRKTDQLPYYEENKTPREPRVKIINLPTEILNQIMDNLEQKDVHALLQANKGLVEIAADYMYYHPKFASTYRFAQFVYTISHHEHYAMRVRHLDVSYFTEVPQLQRTPMAGWREWKYRSHDLYRPPNKLNVPPKKPRKREGVILRRGHPVPNPFLESWALSRDIPLGGLCHCLQACLNLRVVNLSRCQLADDHLVQDVDYPPNAWTGLIYVSDVPKSWTSKSWTWKSDELRPVYNMHVVEQLVKLEHLETIIAANWVGLSTGMVRELVNLGQGSLEKVDFMGSGLEKEKAWAIKGSRKEVKEIIAKMDEGNPAKKIISAKSSP